jgi:hypothetical protein
MLAVIVVIGAYFSRNLPDAQPKSNAILASENLQVKPLVCLLENFSVNRDF